MAFELDALGSSVNNIVNSQISSGAAISDSKLAQISSASKVSGLALTALASIPSGAGIIPAANLPAVAVQADMEAGSSTTAPVVPGVFKYHPGVAKVWVKFNGKSTNPITADASYGISGTVTKNATGDYTITFSTAFSSANYCAIGTGGDSGAISGARVTAATYATGTFRFFTVNTGNTATDYDFVNVCLYGDE